MKHIKMPNRSTIILLAAVVSGAWIPAVFGAELVYTGFFGNTAIKGYDSVAYFTDGQPVRGSKAYTHEWRDAVWRFASAEHRDLFAADPLKYAPQYGGWCAWAMAEGEKVKIDPQAWHITNGKLYLNYNAKIQKQWLADREKRIRDADDQWKKIVREGAK